MKNNMWSAKNLQENSINITMTTCLNICLWWWYHETIFKQYICCGTVLLSLQLMRHILIFFGKQITWSRRHAKSYHSTQLTKNVDWQQNHVKRLHLVDLAGNGVSSGTHIGTKPDFGLVMIAEGFFSGKCVRVIWQSIMVYRKCLTSWEYVG